MQLEKAIKEYLDDNYKGTEEDKAEAAEAMRVYIVEHYIPDVAGMFDLTNK